MAGPYFDCKASDLEKSQRCCEGAVGLLRAVVPVHLLHQPFAYSGSESRALRFFPLEYPDPVDRRDLHIFVPLSAADQDFVLLARVFDDIGHEIPKYSADRVSLHQNSAVPEADLRPHKESLSLKA